MNHGIVLPAGWQLAVTQSRAHDFRVLLTTDRGVFAGQGTKVVTAYRSACREHERHLRQADAARTRLERLERELAAQQQLVDAARQHFLSVDQRARGPIREATHERSRERDRACEQWPGWEAARTVYLAALARLDRTYWDWRHLAEQQQRLAAG